MTNHDKLNIIRTIFEPVIGQQLSGYSTAELLFEDDTWDDWPDLPIRFNFESGYVVAVAWSNYDKLWIATDHSLPFSVDGSTIRWIQNSSTALNNAIGGVIQSVLLGRGDLSIEGRDVEIWTRLLIRTDKGWLEVYNALDENGYDFHNEIPEGEFVICCK